ncbi:methyltransferase domain-containing protein [candidate division KSB1 bacterium]|nr:methyltransferase domain-containing protein [candidate division KSB1 bacterium]
MFHQSAAYYDKIYRQKDYATEVQQLMQLIAAAIPPGARRLLDVACGTGQHLAYLKAHFPVIAGVDLAPELLALARQQHPTAAFYLADMCDFDLGEKFDVITCLFSSIGYVKTLENLNRALGCLAHHLSPGGLLVVEPWFTPAQWNAGKVHVILIDEPELKIVRMSTSFQQDRLSYFDFHYLIGTPAGTEHFVERHELGLFEVAEIIAAFTQQGLKVRYDATGITGRGLYIAQLPDK